MTSADTNFDNQRISGKAKMPALNLQRSITINLIWQIAPQGMIEKEYLGNCKQRKYCVGVLYLSDEWFTATIDYYADADFVLRNSYLPHVAKLKSVVFVPVGHKRGLHQYATQRNIHKRQYHWSFEGQLVGNVSRRSMMGYAKNSGEVVHVEKGCDDRQEFSLKGHVELICDTFLVLSSISNCCAKTSRF